MVTEPRFLSNEEFAFVVRRVPLVSFDIIIKDPAGNVLVGLRTNEPAKGEYFVPGGIIRKNETLADAFARILESELSLKASFSEAKLIGVYEHIYATAKRGLQSEPNFGRGRPGTKGTAPHSLWLVFLGVWVRSRAHITL